MLRKPLGIVACIALIAVGAASLARADEDIADPEVAAALHDCVTQAFDSVAADRQFESCSVVIGHTELNPAQRSVAFAWRGWIESVRKDLPKAMADFDSSLDLDRNYVWALAARATSLVNSGKSDQAIPDYDRAIELRPDDPRLLVGRGVAYGDLKQYDLGLADFDRALAVAPTDEEAMSYRALTLAHKHDFAGAIKGYDQALAVATKLRGVILSKRCAAKVQSGDLDGGMVDCKAALEIDPGNADFLSSRGYAYLKMKNLTLAFADFDDAVRLDPGDPYALYARGVAWIYLGQEKRGREDISAAERLKPGIGAELAVVDIAVPSNP